MKIKSLLIGMLACTALVGCTNNDDPIVDNGMDNDGLKNFAVKIAINVGDAQTSRALTGRYDDGNVGEYGVTNAVVAFYNARKAYLGQANISNTWADDDDPSVTKEATCVFQAAEKPFYAIALLNPSSTITELLADGNSIANLEEKQTEELSTTDNYFFMTNSTYVDGNNVVRKEVELGDNVVEVSDDETVETALNGKKPVDIYVDRVAAKVTMDFSNLTAKTTYTSADNKTYNVYGLKYLNYEEDSDGNASENEGDINTQNGKDAPFGIIFEGWALSGTNKSFYPLKKLSSSYEGLSGITTWNAASDFLSHWAEDDNYNSGSYPEANTWNALTKYDDSYDLKYETEIDNDVNQPLYCYENTYVQGSTLNYPAQTYVVLKAQYMDLTTAEGKTTAIPHENTVYRIGQVVYKEDAIKKDILGLLFNSYIIKTEAGAEVTLTNENKTALLSAVTLTEGEDFGTNEKVQSITLTGHKVYEKNGTTEVKDIKKAYVGSSDILIHANGECVYTIPIEHFGKAGVQNRDNKSLGYWGVVRNHWYVLKVSSIAGFGDPKVEGEPTIPDPSPLKTWAVKCTININAWSKVDQSTEIGGGNEWN